MKKNQLLFNNEAIVTIIDEYTFESGVRNLERNIASVIRSIAKSIASDESYDLKITRKQIYKILGAPKFIKDKWLDNKFAGVVTGLAWTANGGDILFVESSLYPGKGKLTLTGNLGDVMKESATIALDFIKAHAADLELDSKLFEFWDIHIHVPEGATPKDGPSAGITMLSSLASSLTQRKVRKNLQ